MTHITLPPGETPAAVFFYHNVNVTSNSPLCHASLRHQNAPLCHQYPSVTLRCPIMTSHYYCDVKCRVWWSSAPLWHHRIESQCQNSPSCPQNWAVVSHHSSPLSIRMSRCLISMLHYVFTMHLCAITMPCKDATVRLSDGTMFHCDYLMPHCDTDNLSSHHHASVFNQCYLVTPQCLIWPWTSECSIVISQYTLWSLQCEVCHD